MAAGYDATGLHVALLVKRSALRTAKQLRARSEAAVENSRTLVDQTVAIMERVGVAR